MPWKDPVSKALVMFDSADAATIPDDADYAAGYVNGEWPTYDEIVRRLPHARVMGITVRADADAECLDVELGDATADQAGGWVRRQLVRRAHRPCVYANRSTMPAVVESLALAGIHRTLYRLWVADYGVADEPDMPPAGYGAWQWTCNARGINLDQSVCLPGFFEGATP